jgi:hypothetical protein
MTPAGYSKKSMLKYIRGSFSKVVQGVGLCAGNRFAVRPASVYYGVTEDWHFNCCHKFWMNSVLIQKTDIDHKM